MNHKHIIKQMQHSSAKPGAKGHADVQGPEVAAGMMSSPEAGGMLMRGPAEAAGMMRGPAEAATMRGPAELLRPVPGPFSEWDQQLLKLPTTQRVTRIFAKMQKLVIADTLPQKLQYTATEADNALVRNIKVLFPSTEGNNTTLETLKAALLLVVAKADEFMTDTQKAQLDKQKNSFTKEQKQLVTTFYPNLMALIRALLIHCQNLAMQHDGTERYQDSTYSMNKCVLDMWQQILGELHDIHAVIIYANQTDLVSLGEFPTQWMQTIQHMNSDIDHLRSTILVLNDNLNQNLVQLNERDKKIQALFAQYAEYDTKVQLIKAQKNNIMAILENYTSIPSIVTENLHRMA
jgi:hypothetical protein